MDGPAQGTLSLQSQVAADAPAPLPTPHEEAAATADSASEGDSDSEPGLPDEAPLWGGPDEVFMFAFNRRCTCSWFGRG